MNFRIFFISIICLGLPALSHAQPAPPQVLISEIAWMGTDANPDHEWIELYGFAATDLTGWTLTSDDGNVSITLSGELETHGIRTLERGTDDAAPGTTALLTYRGELADSCTTLTLKDPAGNVVDQAVGGVNWSGIGGTTTTPVKTPQRTRFGTWVTAAPTPGLDNAQVDESGFPVDTITCPTTVVSSPTTRSGGGGSSKPKPVFSIDLIAPETMYVGKPATFTAVPMGLGRTELRPSEYHWNFGDTESGEGKEITHSFDFVGEYVVTVEASTTKKHTSTRHDISVLPHPLSLSLTQNGDVTITNITANELTIDGYVIGGDEFEFIFPKYSILKANKAITLSRHKIDNENKLELKDLDDFVIATLYTNKNNTVASTPAPNYLPKISTPASLAETRFTNNVNRSIVKTETPSYKVTTASTNNDKFRFATKNNTAPTPEVTDEDESEPEPENSATYDEQTTSPQKGPIRRILNRIAYFFGIS